MGFLDNVTEREMERQRAAATEGKERPDTLGKGFAASVGFAFSPVGALIARSQINDDTAWATGLLNFFTFGALSRRQDDLLEIEQQDIARVERIKTLEEHQRELQQNLQAGIKINQERSLFV